MPLTHYPHGILATPTIGSSPDRFYGWWGNDSWFVDFDGGSNDNNGKDPQRAFKYPEKALTEAAAGDVIYFRPRNVLIGDTDPQYYTPETAANWIVPRAKYGMSLIGAGGVLGSGQIHQTYLRGHGDVSTSTLNSSTVTVKAPYTSVENLAFHRGANTRSLLEFYGDGSADPASWGSSAYNCLFRFQGNSDYGAVEIMDTWYVGIYNSHFYRNQIGIKVTGSQSTFREVQIVGNIFSGDTADIDAHVVVLGSSGRWIHIYDNYFNSGIPAKSGNYDDYIHIGSAMETGSSSLIANNHFAVDDSTSDVNETTGVIRAGNWDGSGETET